MGLGSARPKSCLVLPWVLSALSQVARGSTEVVCALGSDCCQPGRRGLLPTPSPVGRVVMQPQRLWDERQGRARGVGNSMGSPRADGSL